MSVGRVCTREVFLADREESVVVAAERMRGENVGTLVVLDSFQRPVGILTDRDITTRAVARRRDTDRTTVADIMTPGPRVVSENTPIEDALQLMATGGFRRVPVVDERGALVGLVSLDDLFDLFAEEFISIRKLLRSESRGPTPPLAGPPRERGAA